MCVSTGRVFRKFAKLRLFKINNKFVDQVSCTPVSAQTEKVNDD